MIPRGALVVTNIKKFLMDPELWENPEMFNPNRFLNSAGKFFRPEHFVPLGHGRRVCVGEPLARVELFIFFVCLVQKIKLKTVPGKIPDPNNFSAGITKCPHDFVVAISQRIKIEE